MADFLTQFLLVIVVSLIGVDSISLYDFLGRSNEYDAALYLFQHGKLLDENSYRLEIRDCEQSDWIWCYRKVNQKFTRQVEVWAPNLIVPANTGDRYYRRRKDCSYKIEFIGIRRKMITPQTRYNSAASTFYTINFSFRVVQSDCVQEATGNILDFFPNSGGSTFVSFGSKNQALVACSTYDYLNGTYILTCSYPEFVPLTTNQGLQSTNCMQLTVILEYEHFDSYSAVLASTDWYDFIYPPIKTLLVDNETYCGDIEQTTAQISSVNHELENLFDNTSYDLKDLKRFSFVTGYWMSNTIAMKSNTTNISSLFKESSSSPLQDSFYRTYQEKYLSAKYFNSRKGRIIDYSKAYFNISYPSLSSHSNEIPEFTFQTVIIEINSNSESLIHLPTLSESPFARLDLNASREQSDLNPVHHYYFIGSSHMRYNFETIVSMIANEEVLPNTKKYSSNEYETFHHVGPGALVVRDIIPTLSRICLNNFYREVNYSSNSINTIVFQFGAWDLWHSPLQFIINGSVGEALIDEMERIFKSRDSCPGLVHLVYMTPVPYPLCYMESDDYCHNLRGCNNNAASRSISTFMTTQLMELKRKYPDSIKLTIIDVNSIVKPRLGLSNDEEIVCSTHYLCREAFDGKLRNNVTPGGLAIVEALLRALGLSHHLLQ